MATPKKATAKATAKKQRPPKPKGQQSLQKALHYKRATFIPDLPGGQTLQSLVDAALSKRKKPSKRMERLGLSNDTIRLVNKCYIANAMICGRFLDYTEGGATAVLEIDDDADELVIRELLPKQREQYLEGVLTFGIADNHVILIQAKALKVGHLENHLNWLLGKTTGVLPEAHKVILVDEPARNLKDKLDGVSFITLREPVPGASFVLDTEEKTKDGLDTIIAGLHAMVPSLRNILGERLSPQQALALEDLDVSLKIARKRKKGGTSIIDDVAHLLRNVDDVDVTVKARGMEFRSDDLKLSVTRSVESEGRGMLKLGAAAEVMQDWLNTLIATGRITA
jgi:hypothetical protein